MRRVTAGLFLVLEPGIDVLPEQTHAGFFEVVDLVHMRQAVPFVQCLFEFRGAPGTHQGAGGVPMLAVIHRFGMHGGVDGVVYAGGAEQKGQFPAAPVR